jgi:hypothetical protein
MLFSTDSSQPLQWLDFERLRAEFATFLGVGPIKFSRDGKGITYPVREDHADNLWLQHLGGSPGKMLTDFKLDQIRDFDGSMDGKSLALIRGHRESDVVLIRDLEK